MDSESASDGEERNAHEELVVQKCIEEAIIHRRSIINTWIGTYIAFAGEAARLTLAEQEAQVVSTHISRLSGYAWLGGLLTGNPARIQNILGVSKKVFYKLRDKLKRLNLVNHSRGIRAEEQLAIFLYVMRTGSSNRECMERFQRSGEIIEKYLRKLLVAFSCPPFFTSYVTFPTSTTPTSDMIRNSPEYFPFFEDCMGAVDSTHVPTFVKEDDQVRYRNYRNQLTQNVFVSCSFDMRFSSVLSGWEGCATDDQVREDATSRGVFNVPDGKYFLADEGFLMVEGLMIPYRNVRYHLSAWASSGNQPENKEELFNFRHASLRNVLETTLESKQKQFRILKVGISYDYVMQARISPALAALHNFNHLYDPDKEILEWNGDNELDPGQRASLRKRVREESGNQYTFHGGRGGRHRREDVASNCSFEMCPRMVALRDSIAQAMWDSYRTESSV